MKFFKPLQLADQRDLVGKAARLKQLLNAGFRVPLTYYTGGQKPDEFSSLLDEHPEIKTWIVRSSMACEDSLESSMAGAFASVKVISPTHKTLENAYDEVVASYASKSGRAQILASGKNPDRMRLGVIFQEYIEAEISGIGVDETLEWTRGGNEGLTSGNQLGMNVKLSGKAPVELQAFWRELGRGVKKIERLLKAPADFEWAFDGKRLWWLQIRPVVREEVLGAHWTRDKISERFPSIMTPLGWSLIEEVLCHSLERLCEYIPLVCKNPERSVWQHRGLVYANQKYFNWKNVRVPLWAGMGVIARGFLALLQGIFRPKYLLLRVAHQAILKRASRKVLDEWNANYEQQLSDIRAFDGDSIQAIRRLSFAYFKTDIAIHLLKEAYTALIAKAVPNAHWALGSFTGNTTLEMLQSPEQCGHLTTDWDISVPPLRENPEVWNQLISKKKLQSKSKIPQHLRQGSTGQAAKSVLEAIDLAQQLYRADETQHFYAGLYIEKSRILLKKIAHQINVPEEDIYYLTIQELEAYLGEPAWDLKPFLNRRRRRWERYREKPIDLSDKQSEQASFTGVAASGGIARGNIFFANSWDDFSSMPHDAVLAIRTPNPSYVPWFHSCQAIITQTGSLLSHGLIAARELQIPAVSGIDIDALIPGKRVTVDGHLGRVYYD